MLSVVLVEDEMLVLLGTKMCIQDLVNMNVIATFSTAEAHMIFDSHTADTCYGYPLRYERT